MHVLHCTVANDLLYADVMGGGKRVPYPPPPAYPDVPPTYTDILNMEPQEGYCT